MMRHLTYIFIVVAKLVSVTPAHAAANTATEAGTASEAAPLPDTGIQSNETVSGRLNRIEQRILEERKLVSNQYTLLTHKPNYVLLYSRTDEPNTANWFYDGEPDQEDLIIHLSIKYPLWVQKEARVNRFSVFAAYTQKAFWQAYNREVSRPFRETNHEPELLVNYFPAIKFGGWRMPVITLGINHQSNGQSGTLSRSWNRAYLDFVFAKHDYALSIKPWYRFRESEADDDNPDILDYLGNGEVTFAYGNDDINISLMLRNNFSSDNRGAGQLDLSFPITNNKKLSYYLQVFHGYGESLIDYDYVNTRVGIGILTSNWL